MRHDTLRATWRRVLRDAPALCSSLVLLLFVGVTALDSVHFRRALPPADGQPAGSQFYGTRTESLLDLALARQIGMRETTFSAPLGWQAITKQTVTPTTPAGCAHPTGCQQRAAASFSRPTRLSVLRLSNIDRARFSVATLAPKVLRHTGTLIPHASGCW